MGICETSYIAKGVSVEDAAQLLAFGLIRPQVQGIVVEIKVDPTETRLVDWAISPQDMLSKILIQVVLINNCKKKLF